MFEFIQVEVVVKFMKCVKGGADYKSLGSSEIGTNILCCGIQFASVIPTDNLSR